MTATAATIVYEVVREMQQKQVSHESFFELVDEKVYTLMHRLRNAYGRGYVQSNPLYNGVSLEVITQC